MGRSEQGAISLLTAAGAALMTVVLAALSVGMHLHVARTQLQAAADIAALSAGPYLGRGCELVHQIAAQNGALVQHCERTGLVLQVTLKRSVLGHQLEAGARAAPASSLSTNSAPDLSSGVLPLPHFGEMTQRGHPAVHGQAATRAAVRSTHCLR